MPATTSTDKKTNTYTTPSTVALVVTTTTTTTTIPPAADDRQLTLAKLNREKEELTASINSIDAEIFKLNLARTEKDKKLKEIEEQLGKVTSAHNPTAQIVAVTVVLPVTSPPQCSFKEQKAQPNIDDIGKAFAVHYYTLFDTDRSLLATLYQDESMMTFENEKFHYE